MSLSGEMTFEDLFSDPLTLSLMKADGVDPTALRSDLRAVALRLERPREIGNVGLRAAETGKSRSLLSDCINAKRVAGAVQAKAASRGSWSAHRG